MAKLTVGRPDPNKHIYWPKQPTATSYIADSATDLGVTVYPGYGVSIKFLLPDKQVQAYGQLDLRPEEAEGFIEALKRALASFQPDEVVRNEE